MNYGWRFVTLYSKQEARPPLRKRNAKFLFGERLIHFEFSFAFGVRKGCGVILLHLVDRFFPVPLVKGIVFSPLYSLASFAKIKMSIGVWTYF